MSESFIQMPSCHQCIFIYYMSATLSWWKSFKLSRSRFFFMVIVEHYLPASRSKKKYKLLIFFVLDFSVFGVERTDLALISVFEAAVGQLFLREVVQRRASKDEMGKRMVCNFGMDSTLTALLRIYTRLFDSSYSYVHSFSFIPRLSVETTVDFSLLYSYTCITYYPCDSQ